MNSKWEFKNLELLGIPKKSPWKKLRGKKVIVLSEGIRCCCWLASSANSLGTFCGKYYTNSLCSEVSPFYDDLRQHALTYYSLSTVLYFYCLFSLLDCIHFPGTTQLLRLLRPHHGQCPRFLYCFEHTWAISKVEPCKTIWPLEPMWYMYSFCSWYHSVPLFCLFSEFFFPTIVDPFQKSKFYGTRDFKSLMFILLWLKFDCFSIKPYFLDYVTWENYIRYKFVSVQVWKYLESNATWDQLLSSLSTAS